MYCKKCEKEVIPIKDPKTLGKRVTNAIFAIFAIFAGGAAYTYPKRCPFCNKILRTKKENIVCMTSIIMMAITFGIIMMLITYL